MKTCPRCKETKEDTEFHRNKKTGKLASYCNPCKRVWERERRVLHKEEYNERAREWRKANPAKAREAHYRWRKSHPETWRAAYGRWAYKNRLEYEATRRAAIRDEVFSAYGGYRCACCGEEEKKFLTIDHVNNDGAKHRKELGTLIGRGGTAFQSWLRKNEFPPGFQVLCYNCNCGKARNGGICPHHKP